MCYNYHPASKNPGRKGEGKGLLFREILRRAFLAFRRMPGQNKRPDVAEKMQAQGCVFRDFPYMTFRRCHSRFFFGRQTGKPCLKGGISSTFPHEFLPFFFLGSIQLRLFFRGNVPLRPSIISGSGKTAEHPVDRACNGFVVLVAHDSMFQLPLRMSQSLDDPFRSQPDLCESLNDLTDLAGTESLPEKIGPVKGQVLFRQMFKRGVFSRTVVLFSPDRISYCLFFKNTCF